MEELLQHFSHEHPLALYEKAEDLDGGCDEARKCFGCFQSVRGSSPTYYTCPQCEFFLHKSCATELPEKMMSLFHPRHPVTLIVANETWDCAVCEVTHDLGFAYNCSLCEFSLDIKCASLNNNVIHEYSQGGRHNHSFMLLRPAPLRCDVCGRQILYSAKSYLCTTCQFQSCRDCFPFPLTVKQIGHHHRLSFTSYIDDRLVANSINYTCKICYDEDEVDKRFCFYYCADCNYVAHVQCATRKDLILDDDENQELLLLQPQRTLLSSDDLEHFSHQHCLTLMNNNDDEAAVISEEESSNDDDDHDHNKIILCDGCVQQISSSSTPFYYGCAKCNFYLHTSCAQLPNKILHPLHTHALVLFAEASTKVASIFKCNACGTLCNGFVYMCEEEECKFFIDVKCSFFPDPLEHKGHHCSSHNVEGDDDDYEDGDEKEKEEEVLPLIVHPEQQSDRPRNLCNGCNLWLPSLYRCGECTSFKLDMRCAALPYTTNHKCPKHDWETRFLELTFESIEYVTGEYYCDMCEEKRGKTDWFYYCGDCDYSVHPDCALGKYRIKFEKSYEFSAHPHPLTLNVIEKRKGKPPSCSSCTFPCEELALMCTECNFYSHYEDWCSRTALETDWCSRTALETDWCSRTALETDWWNEVVDDEEEEEVLPSRKFRVI